MALSTVFEAEKRLNFGKIPEICNQITLCFPEFTPLHSGSRRGRSLDDRGDRVERPERVRDAARSLSQGGQQHRLGRRHHGQEGQRRLHQISCAIDDYREQWPLWQPKWSLNDQSVTRETHARDWVWMRNRWRGSEVSWYYPRTLRVLSGDPTAWSRSDGGNDALRVGIKS